MSLFVEFHLIQNFAPSNLNRDDTGAPKDALFGGHRRARISSQCLKKASKDWVTGSTLLPENTLGKRTRHLDRLVGEELIAVGISNPDVFNEVIKLSLKGNKKNKESDKDNQKEDEKLLSYLLYLSVPEISTLKQIISDNKELLLSLSGKKKIKHSDIPENFKKAIKTCLKHCKAIDIAMFGRMLADMPEVNQDAACQVAHAISTHKVDREFDYFTAVDDMGDLDETGAGMIGQIEFNSATFYRYAVLDILKLEQNLHGERDLALNGLAAFAQAMARAIPSGKQNTFAAHNPPSFIGVVLRHSSPFNLANAFEVPVWPRTDQALTALSVAKLAEHDTAISAFYGDGKDRWAYLDMTNAWPKEKGEVQSNLVALAEWIVDRVRAELEG